MTTHTKPPPTVSRTSSADLKAVAHPDEASEQDPPFIAHHAGSLDDFALVPRLLRLVKGELSDLVAHVAGSIVPGLKRLEERQHESDVYNAQQFKMLHDRFDALLGRLESK